MESRKRAAWPIAKQKKAGQRGGPQPAKGFLSGSQVMSNYFGRKFNSLWWKDNARAGGRVGGSSYILRRRWPQRGCADAHREENVLGTKKQRSSRRGVARALEPLEGGKGLILFLYMSTLTYAREKSRSAPLYPQQARAEQKRGHTQPDDQTDPKAAGTQRRAP